MIPRLDPEQLPDNAAADCENCEFRDGTVAPLNLTGTALSLHDAAGKMRAEVAAADLKSIAVPSAPTVASRLKLWNASTGVGGTIKIYVYGYISWTDETTGLLEFDPLASYTGHLVEVPITTAIKHTAQGLLIKANIENVGGHSLVVGRTYNIWGPIFQIALAADPAGEWGGPAEAMSLPMSDIPIQITMGPVPAGAIPLKRFGRVYGGFSVASYVGPMWRQSFTYQGMASGDHFYVEQGPCTFQIDLNYVQRAPRDYKFARSYVDIEKVDDETIEREGPPSELTDIITIEPGETVVLSTPRSGAYTKQIIYRNVPGSKDYWKAGTAENVDSWTYESDQVLPEKLPPYGNFDRFTDPKPTAAGILEGSNVHPDRFAIYHVNGNKERLMAFSDIDRHHAIPDEYTIKCDDDIIAHQVSGRAVYWWAGSKAFAAAGNRPEALYYNMDVLSESAPLLNKCGLMKLDDGRLVWPTYNGLALAGGGGVDIVTDKLFTREKFALYDPANQWGKVIDGVVVLEHKTDATKNLAINLREGTVTRWSKLSGGTLSWTGKKIRFDQPQAMDFLMLEGEGPATTILARSWNESGVENANTPMENVLPGKLYPITTAQGRVWQFSMTSQSRQRTIVLYDRKVIETAGTVTLTNRVVDQWADNWIKFPKPDRFVAGELNASGAGTVYIDFKASDGTVAHTAEVAAGTSGRFVIPRSALTAAEWARVGTRIESASPHTPVHIDSLTLFTRGLRGVGQSWTVNGDAGVIQPWLIEDYEVPGQAAPVSVTIQSSAAESRSMRFYINGSNDPQPVSVEPGVEKVLALGDVSRIGWDFNGADSAVAEVRVNIEALREVTGQVEIGGDHCRGVKLKFANQGTWACGQVLADRESFTANVKLTLGASSWTVPVTSSKVFHFPRTMPDGALWTLDAWMTGAGRIHSIRLWPLQRVGPVTDIHFVRRDPGLEPWADKVFEFEGERQLVSGQVFAKNYTNKAITIYKNRAVNGSDISVANGREFRIEDSLGLAGAVEFEFGGADADVTELRLTTRKVITIGPEGINLRKADGVNAWRRVLLKFEEPGSFSAVRVGSKDYTSMVLGLNADGTAAGSIAIANGGDIALPWDLIAGEMWEIDLAHAADIDEMALIGRVRHELAGGVWQINRLREPWSWLNHQIITPAPLRFAAIRVDAERYPVTVELRQAGVLVERVVAYDGRAMRLRRSPRNRLHELSAIVPAGTVVHGIRLADSVGKV